MKTDKEKIAEVICRVTHKTLLAHCDMQCDVMCIQYAEELVKQGYHKTIWHKVAEGDLPSKTGDYLTISRSGHYCVLKYCAEDFLGPYDEGYDFEKDNNMMNLKKGFNDFDSESCEFFVTNLAIAWAEVPKYE